MSEETLIQMSRGELLAYIKFLECKCKCNLDKECVREVFIEFEELHDMCCDYIDKDEFLDFLKNKKKKLGLE